MLLVKLSLLILFASSLVSVLCFFFDGAFSKVIALTNIATVIVLKALAKVMVILRKRATTIAVAKVRRAITIWEAIQKRSYESIYKTNMNIEAKRLRATTFAIAKLEER